MQNYSKNHLIAIFTVILCLIIAIPLFLNQTSTPPASAAIEESPAIEAEEAENERLESMLRYEKEIYAQGFQLIAGIDEVGRGPLAGPVVAAAVILPKSCKIRYLND